MGLPPPGHDNLLINTSCGFTYRLVLPPPVFAVLASDAAGCDRDVVVVVDGEVAEPELLVLESALSARMRRCRLLYAPTLS